MVSHQLWKQILSIILEEFYMEIPLSLILFVLSVNPLSHLLQQHEGYETGKVIKIKNISHLFLVDDLRLYAINIEKMKQVLETVTQFSNEVGMNFGEAKCAYQSIER